MPKSDQEKAEIRRQTEGRRQPDRSLAVHEAARGVKTGKSKALTHLTRQPLTGEEFAAALAAIKTESDRGVAILAAALVEDSLLDAINAWLLNTDDRNALYHDIGAPFGTLRNKTVAAYALGICDKDMRDQIDIIRSIRNQFSHALRSIDFKNEDIVDLCSRLHDYAKDPEVYAIREKQYGPSRLRFLGACIHVTQYLQRAMALRAEVELDLLKARIARAKSGATDVGDHTRPD
jgi:hypothetical protein